MRVWLANLPLRGRDKRVYRSAAASGARVLAAVEEAVLVVFGRGLAARLDVGLLGRHRLDCGPCGELLEPAFEVRLAVDVGAMGLVLARPWEGRHVGDRVFVATKILGLTQALVEQFIEPQHLTFVAAERILVGLRREPLE